MKVLISGFEPFLGESVNPSELLVHEIKKTFSDISILVLPVEFKHAFEILKKEIQLQKPDVVVMLGQASGRKNISFEKIGLNWIQTNNPDESGFVPKTGPIVMGQVLALMSKFPVDEVVQKLKHQNWPVEVSFSAGTFVCNDLYFKVLLEFNELKSVFIHVPLLFEQIKNNDDRPWVEFKIINDCINETIKLILN
jgi:pyroglutamyl-peptidase